MKSKWMVVLVIGLVAGVAVVAMAVMKSGTRPDASGAVLPQAAPPAASGGTPATAVQADATSGLPAKSDGDASSPALAAIQKAAAEGKYLFAFFYKEEAPETRGMQEVFDAAMKKAADRAESIRVNVTNPSEKSLVAKYNLDRAPMPLVLALAPNGAITGGFPGKFDEDQLLGALASPGMEKCLKSLQEGKLVLLCAQNRATKSNEAATKGVNEFKDDVRFAKFTEIVQVDPADAAEDKLLAQLQIDPKTDEAVTALLAPPGAVIAKYTGATDKNTLLAALMAATSGGCGPSGCGPSGCK